MRARSMYAYTTHLKRLERRAVGLVAAATQTVQPCAVAMPDWLQRFVA
jgi:hypothetical protein